MHPELFEKKWMQVPESYSYDIIIDDYYAEDYQTESEHGIQTGCIYGTAGAVERICSEITRQMGPLPVILTGGNARGIAPIVRHDVCDPDLTLRGLYLFGADFQKNCQCMGESTE